MSGFNGSGTFQISGVGLPYVSGTTISSATANTLNNDLATGLSNCITKDGQQVITANIGWNNHNINNLSSLGIGTATPSGQMQVVNGATTNFIIDSSGNVGIGTSSPASQAKLTVAGPITTTSQCLTAGNPNPYFDRYDLPGAGSGRIVCESTNGVFGIWTQAAERMRIDSAGNVGIGTNSPATKLVVSGLTTADVKAELLLSRSGTNSYSVGQGACLQLASSTDLSSSLIQNAAGAVQFFNHTTALGWNERMRIDSSGNVGIGTSSPAFGLDVAVGGAAGGTIRASYALLSGTSNAAFGTATGFRVGAGNSASDRAELGSSATTSGYIGYSMYSVGASAFRFYVNWAGTINATSSTITAISDQRHKENIRDLDVGLAEVMALKPRTFDWKQGKGKNIHNDRGFIAQEFEQVFPDLIENTIDEPPEGEEPYKAINANLLPVLVKAIQELKTELDTVKSELAALKGS